MTNLNRNWGGSAGKHENMITTEKHSVNYQKKSSQGEHHLSRKSFFTGTNSHLFVFDKTIWFLSKHSWNRTTVQIWPNFLASSSFWQSSLSVWGWQRLYCEGRCQLLYDFSSLSILKASFSLPLREKLQVHDNLGFKFRSSHYNSAGTVKGDKLCMDASETRVVVGAFWSWPLHQYIKDSNMMFLQIMPHLS